MFNVNFLRKKIKLLLLRLVIIIPTVFLSLQLASVLSGEEGFR